MSVRKKIVTTTTPEGEPVETLWWIADYSDGSGLRHQRRFKHKREALALHDQMKVAIRAGTHVSLPNDLTVAGVADKWLKRVEANARERGTLKSYREHVNLHILPRIGKLKLAKLTKGHIEHFRDGLMSGEQKLSRPMAAKVLRSFKSMLKVVGCSHLGDGVTIEIGSRGKPKLEVGRDIPTPQEVTRLVQAAKGKARVLLMTAASTGLRSSELRGLRWHDVDLKHGELHVRQRADRYNVIGRPKSQAGNRTVPLGPLVLNVVREWKLKCPRGEAGLVFPTATGCVARHNNL